MFFMGNLPSKKRSLLSVGPSDSGKSFFATLVRRQLPRSRVFLPLSGSEFCWNELDEKMHLIAFANDWRFTPQLPVQQCLNWLEGLEFTYNRKHDSPQESRGPPGLFTSNDMESGWKKEDIKAFNARMWATLYCCKTIFMANLPEREANKRLEKRLKCAAVSLLWKSPDLAQMAQKENPAAHKEFAARLKAFLSRRNQEMLTGVQCPHARMSEYDMDVAEAELR